MEGNKGVEMKEEEVLDLSKVVSISAQEELKLGAFLSKFKTSIKGDEEMEAIFGNTIDKWEGEIVDKQGGNSEK